MPEPKEVPKIAINDPSPIEGRIAWWTENTIGRAFKYVYNSVADSLRSLIAFAFSEFLELLEDSFRYTIEPLLDDLIDTADLPPSIKHMLVDAKRSNKQTNFFVWAAGGIAVILSLGKAKYEPFGRLATYESETKALSWRPSPQDLYVMHRVGALSREELNLTLDELGIHGRYKLGYENIIRNFFNDTQIANSYFRGLLSETELEDYLSGIGYANTDIVRLKELFKVIPPIQDLIQMGVREAWDDDVASLFGYDNDFSSEFGEWASKQGLSEYWTKKYWRSHWALPGTNDAFDMFHRRIITEEQLKTLLRIKDIPSFWREKLVQLSYNVVTRVDIRRMYELGVVSQDDVYETYLDLGYKPTDAEKLTQWTIVEYGEASRDLTKADVISSYTDSFITRDEATQFLEALNYGTVEIALLLARADLKKHEKYESEFIENVRVAFIGYELTENEVISKLNTLNPPEGFISERLQIWKLQQERARSKPSKTELKQLLGNGIITEEEAREELKKQNYEDIYINWFISLWLPEG